MQFRHTPGPIALRTFRDYGPDFGWFAHCLTCFRDRPFTDADTGHLRRVDRRPRGDTGADERLTAGILYGIRNRGYSRRT